MTRKKRSSRRDNKWNQMREGLTNLSTTKGVEARETVPDIACGKCKNFSETTYASDGRGSCSVVKAGSDFTVDPPLILLEGDTGMMCMFNMDAAKCSHFDLMDIIDTDGNECADPQFRRAQRQMEKAMS